jgi:hypothetical protein
MQREKADLELKVLIDELFIQRNIKKEADKLEKEIVAKLKTKGLRPEVSYFGQDAVLIIRERLERVFNPELVHQKLHDNSKFFKCVKILTTELKKYVPESQLDTLVAEDNTTYVFDVRQIKK